MVDPRRAHRRGGIRCARTVCRRAERALVRLQEDGTTSNRRFSPTSIGCPICSGSSVASSSTTRASADRCARRLERPAIDFRARGDAASRAASSRPPSLPFAVALAAAAQARAAIPRASSRRRRASPRRSSPSDSATHVVGVSTFCRYPRVSRRAAEGRNVSQPESGSDRAAQARSRLRPRRSNAAAVPARDARYPRRVVDRGALPSVFTTIRRSERRPASPSALTASSCALNADLDQVRASWPGQAPAKVLIIVGRRSGHAHGHRRAWDLART